MTIFRWTEVIKSAVKGTFKSKKFKILRNHSFFQLKWPIFGQKWPFLMNRGNPGRGANAETAETLELF